MDARTYGLHNPVKDTDYIPIPTKRNPYDLTVKRVRGCLAVNPRQITPVFPSYLGKAQALLKPPVGCQSLMSRIVDLKRNYSVTSAVALKQTGT